MGCLHGKEQEHSRELSRTQLYEQSPGKRDPWWNMLRGADLSLAYMSELEERIRVVEVSNKSNDKKNMKQKERNREQDEKNRQNEKEIRCLEQMNKEQEERNIDQEQRIQKQEERNRKQEKRNRDQEEANRKQQKMNMEQEQRNTVQEENNKHQEEKNEVHALQNINQKETNRNHVDLVENDFLDTAVEDMIMNFQKDFKKLIDRFGVKEKYLSNDKETQTEKEP